ncbi:MAG: hypothetical protein KJ698_10045 [Actinobacteria bacterium]|nr:hypothetical protein [Actinomycetota bacterium]MBU1494789.1 hypothetical protein [Actinomycetota bacterium]
MSLCDVCGGAEAPHLIDGAGFAAAVRDGYDPFAMGLSGPTLQQIASTAQAAGADPRAVWRSESADRHPADWWVCDGCLPALRPFLDRAVHPPREPAGSRPACSKCGKPNPASQWHCSHCGHIQWGLIVSSILAGLGFVLWGSTLVTWWGTGITWAVALLLLWIGIGSIREGLRSRRDL